MFLRTVIVCLFVVSSVFAENRSKPTGKVFVRYFDPRDLENEAQGKIFDDLQKSLKVNTKLLRFKEIDCSVKRDDCAKLKNKTPSYFLFEGTDLVDVYYGPQTLESLRNYCLMQMGFKLPRSLPVPTATKPDVEITAPQLTADNFEDYISSSNFTFVLFYAPWCPHCKRYMPSWNQLVEKYKDDESMNIACVNCIAEGALCYKHDVLGYPTMKYYKQGSFYKEYESGRKFDEIVDFVESHRVKETEESWEERDLEREIAYEKKKAERAARKARETQNAPKAGEATKIEEPCHVEHEDVKALCLA